MWQWVWIRRQRSSSFCFNMIDRSTFSITDCSTGDCRDSCLTKGERESACRANADFAARVLRQNASLNKPCVVGKASRKFHEFYCFMLFPWIVSV